MSCSERGNVKVGKSKKRMKTKGGTHAHGRMLEIELVSRRTISKSTTTVCASSRERSFRLAAFPATKCWDCDRLRC